MVNDGSVGAEHRSRHRPPISGILLPGLPNEIALTIFARLPLSIRARLCGVCRSWKHSMVSAAMSTIRKELRMPCEVWFLFSPEGYPWNDPCLALVNPLSGCSNKIFLPPRLSADFYGLSADFYGRRIEILGVIGHEVLISVKAFNAWEISVPIFAHELEGLYSFDGACMKWKDGKFSSLDRSSTIGRIHAVDMEGGYLYAETCPVGMEGGYLYPKDGRGRPSYDLKRLDLKSKMWEELPDPRRTNYDGGMLQGRFCIAGGFPEFPYDQRALPLPVETWDPIDRTWTELPRSMTGQSSLNGLDLWCSSNRLVVVKDLVCVLSSSFKSVVVMCYEASSLQLVLTDVVTPDSDLNFDNCLSHLVLLAVGEELWLVIGPNHGEPTYTSMIIMTTTPSPPDPLSWKILLNRPEFAVKGFPVCKGAMIIP